MQMILGPRLSYRWFRWVRWRGTSWSTGTTTAYPTSSCCGPAATTTRSGRFATTTSRWWRSGDTRTSSAPSTPTSRPRPPLLRHHPSGILL